MRKILSKSLIGIGILSTFIHCNPKQDAEHYSLHEKIYVLDGHNDALYTSALQGKDIGQLLPEAHTDLIRLKEGGVNAQVFAVWTDGEGNFESYLDQFRAFKNLLENYPQKVQQMLKVNDLTFIQNEGKIAAILGVEGGHMMEDNLSLIDTFQHHGVKIFTLTWNNSLSWAVSANDEFQLTNAYTQETSKQLGLNEKGVEIVKN